MNKHLDGPVGDLINTLKLHQEALEIACDFMVSLKDTRHHSEVVKTLNKMSAKIRGDENGS